MRLNHPETNAHPRNPWSMEKLSSMKLVPGAKKVGDRCIKASEVGRGGGGAGGAANQHHSSEHPTLGQ